MRPVAYQPVHHQEVYFAAAGPEADGHATTTQQPTDNEELGPKIAGRCAPPPLAWPRNHALAGIKFFDARFEHTLTGFCEKEDLAILVWMITGVKPLYRCADLNCTHWKQLFEALNKGQERKEDTNIISSYCYLITCPVLYSSAPIQISAQFLLRCRF